MCRFYSMSYQDVMGMPLRGFWNFNANVERLRAEENLGLMELFMLGGMGASSDTVTALRDRYLKDMKDPMRTAEAEPVRDPEEDKKIHARGIAQLKALSQRLKGSAPTNDSPPT